MSTEAKQKYRGWTEEEDKWLKDCILEKVKNGHTQQDAFAFISEKTDRSEGSVAFRWNNRLRKDYSDELKAAKEEAKKNKASKDTADDDRQKEKIKSNKKKDIQVLVNLVSENSQDNHSVITLSYDDVISFINEKREMESGFSTLKESYEQLIIEHDNLKEKFEEVVAVITKVKGS